MPGGTAQTETSEMMPQPSNACLHLNVKPYFESGETDFMHCATCGIVLRRPMPTLEDLDAIYAELYRADQIASGQTNQESGSHALSQYAIYLSQRVLRGGTAVLDYGCGSGQLVQDLQSRGLRAVGIERSRGAREFASVHRGLTLFEKLEAVNDGTMDAITMIEVIEHLPDPLESLRGLYRKLRPGGLLFLTTPNRLGLRARMEGGHWREASKKFHVVLFDAASLRALLSSAGFLDVQQIRFSPVQRAGLVRRMAVRLQQAAGLSGTLCFTARKPA